LGDAGLNWTERLRFWLWYYWLEHPIFLVAILSVGYVVNYEYRPPAEVKFWDEGYSESMAEITSFNSVPTRKGRIMMVGVQFEDGRRASVHAYRNQIEGCRIGDMILVQRKGERMRSSGACIREQ
jgi:hypothetical protein